MIERLAGDLRAEFPDMSGLSRSNLHHMRRFAEVHPDVEIVPQLVGQIPWGHVRVLLDRLPGDAPRQRWYAAKTIECGWSRAVLTHQIDSRLHARQGAALSNFAVTLPEADSEAVQEMTKDPYKFEFLGLGERVREHELEEALLRKLEGFLLELGRGFAFVGRQVPAEVDDTDFRMDLLFCHWRLHRFVVIDLEVGEFRPADAGQLNFYVHWANDRLRGDADGDTIGILLCAGRRENVVRYSLEGLTAPLAVATYTLLPPEVAAALPPAEDLSELLDTTIPEDLRDALRRGDLRGG